MFFDNNFDAVALVFRCCFYAPKAAFQIQTMKIHKNRQSID